MVSSRSTPLNPCGTGVRISRVRGMAGFANSARNWRRFASLYVTRTGMRNTRSLQGQLQRQRASCNAQESRHGRIALLDDLLAELHELLEPTGLELLEHGSMHRETLGLGLSAGGSAMNADRPLESGSVPPVTYRHIDGGLGREAALDERLGQLILWLPVPGSGWVEVGVTCWRRLVSDARWVARVAEEMGLGS